MIGNFRYDAKISQIFLELNVKSQFVAFGLLTGIGFYIKQLYNPLLPEIIQHHSGTFLQ